MPGDPYPGGLVRDDVLLALDEVNSADPNSPWKSPVWSFSIPPRSHQPIPGNGDKYQDPGVT